MRSLATILLIALFACAHGPPPIATEAVDWQVVDEDWSLLIVTHDPDGDERVTRIWHAVVDGEGVLRTQDSRWWANLTRDPNCSVRVDDVDYPLVAEFVSDLSGKVRIDEAFSEKYGWQEGLLFPQDRGETHENYARLRFRTAP